jgi:hypothetical protein
MESIEQLLNKIKIKIKQVLTTEKSSESLEIELSYLLLQFRKQKDESKYMKFVRI